MENSFLKTLSNLSEIPIMFVGKVHYSKSGQNFMCSFFYSAYWFYMLNNTGTWNMTTHHGVV